MQGSLSSRLEAICAADAVTAVASLRTRIIWITTPSDVPVTVNTSTSDSGGQDSLEQHLVGSASSSGIASGRAAGTREGVPVQPRGLPGTHTYGSSGYHMEGVSFRDLFASTLTDMTVTDVPELPRARPAGGRRGEHSHPQLSLELPVGRFTRVQVGWMVTTKLQLLWRGHEHSSQAVPVQCHHLSPCCFWVCQSAARGDVRLVQRVEVLRLWCALFLNPSQQGRVDGRTAVSIIYLLPIPAPPGASAGFYLGLQTGKPLWCSLNAV